MPIRLWRKRRDEDFHEEIEAHLALEIDRLVGEGIDPDEARAAARRTFGNAARAQEHFYESRRILWVDALLRDVRHTMRGAQRNPGFAVLAILTLALGIGANTAIFSVVRAVLLRPPPYAGADRIVRIYEEAPGAPDGMRPLGLTKDELDLLGKSSWTLTHVGIYLPSTMTLSGGGEAVRMTGMQISPELVAMLGVGPALGRIFGPHEDAPMDRLVVLSYSAWQRRFSSDVDVIGRAVMLDGNPYTVIGVMPRGFYFPDPDTEYWVPFAFPRGARLVVTARVRDGIGRDAASREIGELLDRVRSGSLYPAPPPPPPPPPPRADGRPRTLEEVLAMSPPMVRPLTPGQMAQRKKAEPLRIRLLGFQDFVIGSYRRALLMLAGAVGFVLLIACANVANLLLARGAARQHEFIVRLAIGASRGRLVRQLLTESTLLAGAGAAVGTALAIGAVHVFRSMGSALPRAAFGPGFGIPRLDEVAIDPSVLTFTGCVAVLAGIAAGVIPAVQSAAAPPGGPLRSAISASDPAWRWSRGARLRPFLVVFELTLATMLFVSAALLMRSFVNLSAVHPGYEAAGVLTFQVVAPRDRKMRVVKAALSERIASLPGVESVAFADQLPTGGRRGSISLRKTPEASGGPPPPPSPGGSGPPQFPNLRVVSSNFTNVMRMRIAEGRALLETDVAASPSVMLINQTLARSGYLGPHPVGSEIYAIGSRPWRVVGIVEDVHQAGLDQEPGPEVLIPEPQFAGVGPGASTISPFFVVRTRNVPAAAIPEIRAVIAGYDSQLGLDRVATMEDIVSNTLIRPRFFTMLLGTFAAFAVFLASTGIYGVLSYMVRQRSREIGIRMSLGATRAGILTLVLREGALLSTAGVMLGLAGSVAVTRALSNQLFGVAPFDVPTYLGVALSFGLLSTLASYVPARRATRVDPVIALRHE
ncbi:MAG TPA: ABC transporter permease [Vicinamibacterales bacterium]|jgi:putative ABC transport system permease protein